MDEKQFTEYLKCGLGRCITFLRAAHPDEREKYRAAALDCCMHNYGYDVQSEGTRAEYKYEIATCFGDPEYFISAVTAALLRADDLTDDFDWDFKGYVDFLCVCAKNGRTSCADALRRSYAAVYDMLIDPKPRRSKRRDEIDATPDHYENLCVALCDIDGLDGFIRIARDLGRLFGASDYSADFFDWTLWFCEDKFGKSVVRERLKAESKNDEYIAAYLASAEQTIKPITPLSQSERAERDKKFRQESDERRLKEARAFLRESDENKKNLRLSGCTEGFPLDPAPVVACARRGGAALRGTALEVLSNTVSPAVRQFALELIEQNRCLSYAIPMLIRNYTEADCDILLGALENGAYDPDDRHSFGFSIIEACEDGRRLPLAVLEYVYYYRCAVCRYSVVKIMAERGVLPRELALECRYDCNPELREFVAGRSID